MKLIAFVLVLLLAGCAGKHYQVCIVSSDGASCMLHTLSKDDATGVGNAIARLGYDVVVKPKKAVLPQIPASPAEPPTDSKPL